MRTLRSIPKVSVILVFFSLVANGGDPPPAAETVSDHHGLQLEPTLDWFGQMQLWSVYTRGAEDLSGSSIDDRWDLFLRRGRLGARGRIIEPLRYTMVLAFDNLGKNAASANPGAAQDDGNETFRVWDLFFTYAADPRWANLTFGYLRPQVGRESITSSFEVDSFTKALASATVRRHLVGRSTGRETGVNLGGLAGSEGFGLNYNLGLFDTNHSAVSEDPSSADPQAGGADWAPLATARVAISIGDPEMERYGISYRNNAWGERNGTTLAFNVTDQGKTDAFDRNNLFGVDLLANYGDLNLTAEFDWLRRDSGSSTYTDRVYNLRAGYNFHLADGRILEPVVMYTRANGAEPSAVLKGSSQDQLDIGVDYYLSRNRLKLNLHYVFQDDDRGRGDFLGIGLQVKF